MVGLRPVRLDAVTRVERHAAVQLASDAIQHAGGWVEDVQFFSNLSATIHAAIPAGRLQSLKAALEDAGLHLSATAEGPEPADEMPVSLRISFLHDEPDLRRAVPSVPG